MISINTKKRIYTSLSLFILFFLMMHVNFIFIFSLIILSIFSFIEFTNIIKKIFKKKIYLLLTNLIFLFYIFSFSLTFFILSNFLQLKILMLIILLGCVASDIGGFIFGKLFKGPKLTKISPNKTISGAVGSVVFTVLTIISLIYFFYIDYSSKLIFISIFVSIACQLGDLFFSYLKRKAKIKNTGNFLPGHGGFLDRLDGILLGLPIGLISFILFYS